MIQHCFSGFGRGREYVTGALSILISDLGVCVCGGEASLGEGKITGGLV